MLKSVLSSTEFSTVRRYIINCCIDSTNSSIRTANICSACRYRAASCYNQRHCISITINTWILSHVGRKCAENSLGSHIRALKCKSLTCTWSNLECHWASISTHHSQWLNTVEVSVVSDTVDLGHKLVNLTLKVHSCYAVVSTVS